MFHTILFDLDGTLTDPKEGITRSVAYALEAFGIKEEPDHLTCFIGPPLKESFIEYYHLTESEADKAIEKYRERYSQIGLFENKVYEGIPEILRALKEQGKKLAVATSKPYIFAKQILEKYAIANYFDWIVGSELDGTRVKKAEVIEEVLKQAKIAEEERKGCLMVGDRKHDIQGAKACQMASMGVKFGYAEDGELEKAGAIYIVNNVAELGRFLLEN